MLAEVVVEDGVHRVPPAVGQQAVLEVAHAFGEFGLFCWRLAGLAGELVLDVVEALASVLAAVVLHLCLFVHCLLLADEPHQLVLLIIRGLRQHLDVLVTAALLPLFPVALHDGRRDDVVLLPVGLLLVHSPGEVEPGPVHL